MWTGWPGTWTARCACRSTSGSSATKTSSPPCPGPPRSRGPRISSRRWRPAAPDRERRSMALTPPAASGDPLWYKDAIIYEVHVRAFADSNRDGIGDFAGLTGKLDYLKDLGVTTIWVLPFYPSP